MHSPERLTACFSSDDGTKNATPVLNRGEIAIIRWGKAQMDLSLLLLQPGGPVIRRIAAHGSDESRRIVSICPVSRRWQSREASLTPPIFAQLGSSLKLQTTSALIDVAIGIADLSQWIAFFAKQAKRDASLTPRSSRILCRFTSAAVNAASGN
jgi:hypothetical protein